MQDKPQHPHWKQSIAVSSQSGASSKNSLSCIVETEKDDEALKGREREGRQEVDKSSAKDYKQKLKRKKKQSTTFFLSLGIDQVCG